MNYIWNLHVELNISIMTIFLDTSILKDDLRSQSNLSRKKNTLKDIQVLLYTHFYNISLNVLRPNFFNIFNLPISNFPNIKKIRVKVGPKTNYFSYFMSSCTNRIVVFNNFFSPSVKLEIFDVK